MAFWRFVPEPDTTGTTEPIDMGSAPPPPPNFGILSGVLRSSLGASGASIWASICWRSLATLPIAGEDEDTGVTGVGVTPVGTTDGSGGGPLRSLLGLGGGVGATSPDFGTGDGGLTTS